ncbi:hypothetical protein GCM10022199_04310 [Marihabitans asiaticum]|uniref:ATP-binding cassette subfamily C protein CydC n=1 Tax=Marihabitans asiaticum TaxID=415218 RepID=A0A560WE02_9MICO|nr:thiol reductant ABC exporter subunit CydC [Marihabitans asiaticum]TWD15897.1 ATP-binding cassette subfamily C protein CydC [Marihabitans asiaticum]
MSTTSSTDRRVLGISPRIIVAGLLAGAAAASGVALTTTSGWLIVRADQRPQILLLLTAIVGVRTFGLGRPVFRYFERVRSHDAALDVLARRRAQTYADLVPLTPARLGRRGRADLLTGVVDDLTDVTEAPVRFTVPVLGALAAGAVATTLTASLVPAVGAVLAAMLLVCAALVALCYRLESRSQARVLAARSEVVRVGHLTARHAGELQAVGGQDAALRWLDDAHDELRGRLLEQSQGRALVSGGVLLTTVGATVASAYLAVGSGVSSPVQALLVLAPVATGEILGVLTDATRALARATAGQDRLDTLLAQEPAVVDHDVDEDAAHALVRSGRTPALQLEQAVARWSEGRPAVGPVDLVLEPGEHVALVGPNGSGKTTLLSVLARHLELTSGSYLVDGRDARELPAHAVRSLFAVVDDEPHVFASTLRNNLLLAAGPPPSDAGSTSPDPDAEPASTGPSDEVLLTSLRRAGLADWLQALPDGLDTRIGTGGHGISGGERARLAVARALLSQRPVLLLDEPGAHLDHPTAQAVIHDLLTAASGRTVVIVTHHGVGAEQVDRVVDLTREKVA